jgi:hypothetical protein
MHGYSFALRGFHVLRWFPTTNNLPVSRSVICCRSASHALCVFDHPRAPLLLLLGLAFASSRCRIALIPSHPRASSAPLTSHRRFASVSVHFKIVTAIFNLVPLPDSSAYIAPTPPPAPVKSAHCSTHNGAAWRYCSSILSVMPAIIGGPQNVSVWIATIAAEVHLYPIGSALSEGVPNTRDEQTYVSTIHAEAAPWSVPTMFVQSKGLSGDRAGFTLSCGPR